MTAADIAFDTLAWVWCLMKRIRQNAGKTMLAFLKNLERHSRAAIIVAALLMVAAVGYLDYATGPDISLSVFYLLAVALAVWFF